MIQEFNSWQDERLGVFTASRISELLTAAKGDKDAFGAVANAYIMEKVCELLTGETKPETYSKAIEWGTEHEAAAMALYIKRTQPEKCIYYGKSNPQVFSMSPAINLLGSPDGLIFDKKVIEVKCPYNTVNHVENLMLDLETFKKERKEYYAQIQVNMLVTDTNIADFVSYDPRMIDERLQLFILEIPKDSEFQNTVIQKVEKATEMIKDIVKQLKS